MMTDACCTLSSELSVYNQALGPMRHRLAPVLSRLHGGGVQRMHGPLRVRVGSRALTRFLMWLARRPAASEAAHCVVRLTRASEGERWERVIGGRPMVSVQRCGGDREIIEHVGPLAIHLRLRVEHGGLWLRSLYTTLLGLRLPALLGLSVVARERSRGPHAFQCDVRVRTPLLGCLLHYTGTLQLDQQVS